MMIVWRVLLEMDAAKTIKNPSETAGVAVPKAGESGIHEKRERGGGRGRRCGEDRRVTSSRGSLNRPDRPKA